MAEEMIAPTINKTNVGRIAERIVANELESRGFRVSDLNSDGLSANADLLASGAVTDHAVTRQIQVKGATNSPNEKRWWVQYGYCTDEIIRDSANPMFNRRNSFYRADFVVLVAVRSVKDYRCFVLPVTEAENAAKINVDREYRTLKKGGEKKKPNKVWISLEPAPREDRRAEQAKQQLSAERAILKDHENAWELLGSVR